MLTITLNIAAALKTGLRGKKCRPYASDMRVAIDIGPDLGQSSGAFYYPDVLVTCSDRDRASNLVKQDPSLVVEVLSKSTATKDRTEKLDNYRNIPSLVSYWLVDQTRRHVVVYSKCGIAWTSVEHSSGSIEVELPSGGVELTLEEVYEDVLGLEQ